MDAQPNIYEYLDYRKYLWDFFTYLKEKKHFTTREFASLAGLKDPNYLKLLQEHKRQLKAKTARQMGHRLGLSIQEIDFFEALVNFAGAEGTSEKNKALEKLLSFKAFRKVHPHAELELSYFQHWQNVACYEAIDTVWNDNSLQEKAKDLGVSVEEVRKSIEALIKLGWVERSGTKLVKKEQAIETAPEIHHHYIRNLHRQMLKLSVNALDDIPVQERFFSGIAMPLSKEQFEDLKKLIYEFMTKLPQKFSDKANADQVYQFQIAVIPLLTGQRGDAVNQSGGKS